MIKRLSNSANWVTITITLILLASALGCATTATTESLLTQAGFKAMTPKTPQQEQYFQSLAAHKFTKAVRKGQEYFVYPDRGRHVLYVGRTEQYDAYWKLKRSLEAAEEANNPAAAAVTDFEVWAD